MMMAAERSVISSTNGCPVVTYSVVANRNFASFSTDSSTSSSNLNFHACATTSCVSRSSSSITMPANISPAKIVSPRDTVIPSTADAANITCDITHIGTSESLMYSSMNDTTTISTTVSANIDTYIDTNTIPIAATSFRVATNVSSNNSTVNNTTIIAITTDITATGKTINPTSDSSAINTTNCNTIDFLSPSRTYAETDSFICSTNNSFAAMDIMAANENDNRYIVQNCESYSNDNSDNDGNNFEQNNNLSSYQSVMCLQLKDKTEETSVVDDEDKLIGFTAEDIEDLKQSLLCPICYDMLWKPIILDCGHSFCFWCIFQSMDHYAMSSCPLCKASFDCFPRVCRPIYEFIRIFFPRKYAQRSKENEEFEQKYKQQSPADSVLEDPLSGATTQFVASKSLQAMLLKFAHHENTPYPTNNMLFHRNEVHNVEKYMRENQKGCYIGDYSGHYSTHSEQDGSHSCGKLENPEANPHNAEVPLATSSTDENVQPFLASSRSSTMSSIEEPFLPSTMGISPNSGITSIPELCCTEDSSITNSSVGCTTSCCTTLSSCSIPNPCSSVSSYLLSENMLNMEDFIHFGAGCDCCGKTPIVGRRYKCIDCNAECGYDLCGICWDKKYSGVGRFNQEHKAWHRMCLVELHETEKWAHSLNRMKKIHPDLSVHEILQWILMHYQDSATDIQSEDSNDIGTNGDLNNDSSPRSIGSNADESSASARDSYASSSPAFNQES